MDAIVRGLTRRKEAPSILVPGYKHASSMTIITALAGGIDCSISNVPLIDDTKVVIDMNGSLGFRMELIGRKATIRNLYNKAAIPKSLSAKIHNTMYLLPALCARQGSLLLPSTGGCLIGSGLSGRPIEHVMDMMKRSGAECHETSNGVYAKYIRPPAPMNVNISEFSTSQRRPEGPFVSGATKTAVLLALHSKERSRIMNPYMKGDVRDMLGLLSCAGFDINVIDKEIVLSGNRKISGPVSYEIMPDPSVVVTFACVSQFLGIPLVLDGINRPDDLAIELQFDMPILDSIGPKIECVDKSYVVTPKRIVARKMAIEIVCGGVLSDHQPFYALLMSGASGGGSIVDYVWTERFSYVKGLNEMRGGFSVDRNRLSVLCGHSNSRRVSVKANDLRAAAALIICALEHEGSVSVKNIDHLSRGYENFIEDLRKIGAKIDVVG